VRGWSALVRLPKTAYWKHSAALEAASKAAAEALAKLDFSSPRWGRSFARRSAGHRRPVYFPESARISSEYIK